MPRMVAVFLADDSGATAIEYGLIAAMIAVGAILAFTSLGNGLRTLFDNVDERAGNVITEASGSL